MLVSAVGTKRVAPYRFSVESFSSALWVPTGSEDDIHLPQTEEDVIQHWREIDAFQTQLRLTKGSQEFNFYDGPPFATGLPPYGHLLTSTIKDIIPRHLKRIPSLKYLEILDEKTGKQYILMESGLSMLYKDPKKARYKVLDKILGKDMIGWKYEPLFNYLTDRFSDCFRVIRAEYVEEGEGTGPVHQAPAFGQKDYDAAVSAGFTHPKRLPPCPVDDKGCFTSEVPDYAGQNVKVADKAILKDLRGTGRLLVESHVTHTDKFYVESLKSYIREELNVRDVILTSEEQQYTIQLEARVDWPTLGKKLKKDAQRVRKALPSLTQEQLRQYQPDGKMTVDGIEPGPNDLSIVRVFGNADSIEKEGPQCTGSHHSILKSSFSSTRLLIQSS
ncbi:Valyl/Leucyl/Isoleucyl-tRNA synthetase [Poronia punctata]|nr:Valyl/Leucyl/Isoleucyl-tRNA synthetase [Poronia punctata]